MPVFVRGRDEAHHPFVELGTLLNVSAGGALLAIRKRLRRSARLLLEFPSAMPESVASRVRTQKHRAHVVRTTYSDRLTLCGLEFSRPLAE